MTFAQKLKWIVLPSMLLVGMGILEIHHPHAMDGFDDGYTGRGAAGLILLLIELFLKLTWGKIGGIVAITIGSLICLMCLLPSQQPISDTSSVESNSN